MGEYVEGRLQEQDQQQKSVSIETGECTGSYCLEVEHPAFIGRIAIRQSDCIAVQWNILHCYTTLYFTALYVTVLH